MKAIKSAEDIRSANESLSPKAKATFQLIVDTAHESFSKHGYELTSIKSIADDAGISVGLIYKYFSNKEELYRYIVLHEQKAIKAFVRQGMTPGMSRLEKEKLGLRNWLHYVLENKDVYKLIWESLFFDKASFDEYYRNFALSYRQGLGMDEDQLSENDVKNLAWIMIGINTFLGLRVNIARHQITEEEIDEMVETVSHVLQHGWLK